MLRFIISVGDTTQAIYKECWARWIGLVTRTKEIFSVAPAMPFEFQRNLKLLP